ncbi:DUF4190 domain-containing protein [Sinosporangium siamense]|uniref:DUF4190 domain-containing protein n=1 Tax=Sinosporangium siamense TaxID=1367973 RepID=A0A919RPA5_9ACTN|nr:DUF4190 domain-containing protein [Sinosporangium siamense]GII95906.1 hypothetical protein Ssi02_61370 [Sinosporangium siamense]
MAEILETPGVDDRDVTDERLTNVALVLAILGVFLVGITSIPAVVLGHMAVARRYRAGAEVPWRTIAALVVGYVGLAVYFLAINIAMDVFFTFYWMLENM